MDSTAFKDELNCKDKYESLKVRGTANELLDLLKQRNKETWAHSLRVDYYCRKFGCTFGLTCRELNQLSIFALFHDVGKLEIDQEILRKRGRLNADEWEEIKRHPQEGQRIALETPEISDAAELILYHHEHWDGSGYPKGLKEKKIPLLCRILAILDAFDAMTSDRSYRKAMNYSQTICELKHNAGKQFDPEITEMFIHSGISQFVF